MRKELRPVFAEFGACIQVAQVMEYGLSTLLALAGKQEGSKLPSKRFAQMNQRETAQTLGELFSSARQKEYFTDAEVKMVFRAISERNKLVHNYMIDNVEKLLNPEGREWITDDVRKRRKVIEDAGKIVESMINRYLEEEGSSMDELKDQVEAFFDAGDDKIGA